MKNIKALFSVLLLLLATFQFHEVQASNNIKSFPVYQEVISEISLGYNGAMLNGDIKLGSGGVFHIIDYKIRDDNAMNQWRVGDPVTFEAHVHKGKLILTIKRLINGHFDGKAEPYVVFDNINSPKNCLTIVEIRDGGQFVKLSDNSIWHFSFYNRYSTEDWKVGERVLVSGNGKTANYFVINLDVPVKHSVHSAVGTFVVD